MAAKARIMAGLTVPSRPLARHRDELEDHRADVVDDRRDAGALGWMPSRCIRRMISGMLRPCPIPARKDG